MRGDRANCSALTLALESIGCIAAEYHWVPGHKRRRQPAYTAGPVSGASSDRHIVCAWTGVCEKYELERVAGLQKTKYYIYIYIYQFDCASLVVVPFGW